MLQNTRLAKTPVAIALWPEQVTMKQTFDALLGIVHSWTFATPRRGRQNHGGIMQPSIMEIGNLRNCHAVGIESMSGCLKKLGVRQRCWSGRVEINRSVLWENTAFTLSNLSPHIPHQQTWPL